MYFRKVYVKLTYGNISRYYMPYNYQTNRLTLASSSIGIYTQRYQPYKYHGKLN